MPFTVVMTLTAWVPAAAAFESDRNNVEIRPVMRASCLIVDQRAKNLLAVDDAHY
jgi:hypothetical protein